MSRLGTRISADFLEKGQQYNVKRKTGEAVVQIVKIRKKNGQIVQINAQIVKDGFDVGPTKYRTGDVVELPSDSDFYEQTL